jgi:hypothetical protein
MKPGLMAFNRRRGSSTTYAPQAWKLGRADLVDIVQTVHRSSMGTVSPVKDPGGYGECSSFTD